MRAAFRRSVLPFAILLICAAAVVITGFAPAATQNQARVTEVIHDVRLLAAKASPRPAIVNDTVREGNAVRTGTDSRAELTFLDETITRLGANTVFSFGAGTRAFDLSSGAILVSAPKEAGTVRVTTAVATCAMSGFTAILEAHRNSLNKVLVLEGDGDVALKKNPNDTRHMHSAQILIFRPDASVLPQPQDFSVCQVIDHGLLITGFKHKLPSMPLLLAECAREGSHPGTKTLIDPTSQNTIDQSINARPKESPPPVRPTPPPGSRPR